MTQLPNPFLNSTVSPRAVVSTADSACRLQNVARPDATAERDPHPNSVSPSPDLISEHARSAVASSDLQPRATAEPISQSALASAMTADTAAAPDLTDPPVAAAVLIAEPTSSTGGPQETPASAPTKNPDVGVLEEPMTLTLAPPPNIHLPDATDCIHEIFAGARKLNPPIDFEEDELPLFIRDGDHLRRWEA